MAAAKRPGFRVQLDVVSEGYDGKTCWFHPRAGAIPGRSPTVVLAMQRWLLAHSDVFEALHSCYTTDLGKTWSPPVEHADTLGRHPEPGGVVVGICDFTPKWHARTKTLLGIGHTVRYLNDKLIAVRSRETAWSTYDPARKTWTPSESKRVPVIKGTDWPTVIVAGWLLRTRMEGRERTSVLPAEAMARKVA